MMKRTLLMVAVVAVVASTGVAASLTSVGVLDPASAYSDVKALTVGSDGTVYAVGGSTFDIGYGLKTQPFVWDPVNGMQRIPHSSGSADNHDARGVSVIEVSGLIAISGRIGAIARGYTAPLTNLAGGSWASYSSDYDIGAYNTSRTNQSRTDGRTQLAGWNTKTTTKGFRWRFYPDSGAAEYNGTGTTNMQSISEAGIPVGTDRGGVGGQRRAVYGPSANGNVAGIPGGGLIRSEGYGISADGQWMSGLDYNTASTNQGFRWKLNDASMELLGIYGSDTVACAYAINNGSIAVGSTYNSTESNRAVVWDENGVPTLLEDLLNAAGVDTSAWTKLYRATTVSDDGTVIGGYGIWAADGTTRGFVAVVPEPATLALLALGLPFLRRRRS